MLYIYIYVLQGTVLQLEGHVAIRRAEDHTRYFDCAGEVYTLRRRKRTMRRILQVLRIKVSRQTDAGAPAEAELVVAV